LRILIKRPAGIGDMVVTFPFVRKVRELYPDGQIDYLINGNLKELIFCLCPEISQVISGNNFNAKAYDIIYDLQKLSQQAFQQRRGKEHQLDIFCDYYGFRLSAQEKQVIRELKQEDSIWAHKYIRYHLSNYRDKKIVGIVLSDRNSQKVWPYNKELIDYLSRDGRNLILLLGHSLFSNKLFNKERILNVTELTSLRQVISLVNCCNLVITPDTGLLHVAGILGIPFISIFGSTPGQLITKYYSSCYRIMQNQLCDSICWQRNFATCNKCLKSISVEDVLTKIEKFLAKNAVSKK